MKQPRRLTCRVRPNPRGFTLLEVVLSMMVMALLALSLYTALQIGTRARQTSSRLVTPMRATAVAMDLAKQDLESILPPTGVLAGAFLGYHKTGAGSVGGGSGDLDEIEFYTVGSDGWWDDRDFSEGIRRVQLLVLSDQTPGILVRRVTRNLLSQMQIDPEEEILCRNVRSFTLRYFDGASWLEDWDSTTLGDVLPMAIAMTIEIDSGQQLPNGQPKPYRMTRIIPLACAKPADDSATGGATP